MAQWHGDTVAPCYRGRAAGPLTIRLQKCTGACPAQASGADWASNSFHRKFSSEYSGRPFPFLPERPAESCFRWNENEEGEHACLA